MWLLKGRRDTWKISYLKYTERESQNVSKSAIRRGERKSYREDKERQVESASL